MNYLSPELNKLRHGCERARSMCAIYEYMDRAGPGALDCTDLLRSAVMISVSAFDLFLHEIIRIEVRERVENGIRIENIRVPISAVVCRPEDQSTIIDECLALDNSYKSFVSPDKFAECMKPFLSRPWDDVATLRGEDAESLKRTLRSVVDLRNRIAHEADLNPNYAGIEMWPIYQQDVADIIDFIESLSESIAAVLVDSFASEK